MRALALLLLLPAAPLSAAGAKKKDAPAKHASRIRVGRQLFGRVYQVGRPVTGAMVADGTLPPDKQFKEYKDVVVAVDSSWCEVQISMGNNGKDAAEPSRIVDHGCTGSLATSDLDWGGITPTKMTQSRLDGIYSRIYAQTFGE